MQVAVCAMHGHEEGQLVQEVVGWTCSAGTTSVAVGVSISHLCYLIFHFYLMLTFLLAMS